MSALESFSKHLFKSGSVLSLFTLSFEHSPKLVLSLYILSLKQLLTDDTDEILLPGYIFKMKNRKTFACRKSGGIVLGYREKFEGDIEVIETENKFALWCKISSKLMP
jgi:hypothetical protein